MTNQEILAERRESLRRANKQHYYERANIWVQSANDTEAKIRNFLFTFAVFLFTFSPVGIIKEVTNFDQVQVKFIWGFLAASLISGLVHLCLDLKFYSKTTKLTNQLEGVWSRPAYPNQKEFKTMLTESEKIKKNMPKKSSSIPLVMQIIFTIIAFGTILFIYWDQAQPSISGSKPSITPSQSLTSTPTPLPGTSESSPSANQAH